MFAARIGDMHVCPMVTGIVPHEILSRRTKQLGARTHAILVERHWQELQAVFRSPLSSQFRYVNGPRLLEKLDAARNGHAIHVVRMSRTLSLEFWLRDLVARRLIGSSNLPSLAPMPQPAQVSTQSFGPEQFPSLLLAKSSEHPNKERR